MTAEVSIIPRHSPEVMDAKTKRSTFVDDSKIPTSSIRSLDVLGTEISSRYGQANELELMRDIIIGLPHNVRPRIASIWCDSKATWTFTVELRAWDAAFARQLGKTLEGMLLERNGGHNGIDIQHGAQCATVHPWWHGDDASPEQRGTMA
jgi:hypothetical protein